LAGFGLEGCGLLVEELLVANNFQLEKTKRETTYEQQETINVSSYSTVANKFKTG
jgi:hypothetical protein